MESMDLKDIIGIARNGSEAEWRSVLRFLKAYSGEDAGLHGVRLYLEDHGWARESVTAFEKEVTDAGFRPVAGRKLRLNGIPAWAMVAAALLIVAGGLYLNEYVQDQSLHVAEAALPVYLSAGDDAVFNKAMSLYKKGDYPRAALLFNQVKTDTALYYKAVCFEMLGFASLGERSLKMMDSRSEYYTRSRIRLAAIYLESGDPKAAAAAVHGLEPANRDEADRLRSIQLRFK